MLLSKSNNCFHIVISHACLFTLVPNCAAPGCNNRSSEFKYHRFPKDDALKHAWITKMRRLDPEKKSTGITQYLWEPTPGARLCSVSLLVFILGTIKN